jgi:TldD protein
MRDAAKKVMDEAASKGVSFADIRIVSLSATSIIIQDGRADKVSGSNALGAGIRALVDGAWGFSCCDGAKQADLAKTLDEAIAAARASKDFVPIKGEVYPQTAAQGREECVGEVNPDEVPLKEKMKRLSALESAARKEGGSCIVNTVVGYGDGTRHEVIANTLGTLAERTVNRASVTGIVTAHKNGVRQRAVKRKAIVGGAELLERLTPDDFTVRLARKAIGFCGAKVAPAGTFPVIFHPSITGLLAHEAIGHNAEADHVWSGESILAGKLGQEIASPLVTIYDDPTTPGAYGSYEFDSEGTPGEKKAIIEKGVLRNYLHSLETASRFDVRPNGSARAEDHGSRPIVRMSNTYVAPGESSFEDLLKGVERGIYLMEGHWGYVFVEKGKFTCHAGEARMIENGALGEPLRDVSVSGFTLEALKNIDMVASDFEMDMPGVCGKEGQGAATDAGGPHIRISALVVGGRLQR